MLNKQLIEDTLTAALSTGGDFAEVFVEDRTNNGIVMIGEIGRASCRERV